VVCKTTDCQKKSSASQFKLDLTRQNHHRHIAITDIDKNGTEEDFDVRISSVLRWFRRPKSNELQIVVVLSLQPMLLPVRDEQRLPARSLLRFSLSICYSCNMECQLRDVARVLEMKNHLLS